MNYDYTGNEMDAILENFDKNFDEMKIVEKNIDVIMKDIEIEKFCYFTRVI